MMSFSHGFAFYITRRIVKGSSLRQQFVLCLKKTRLLNSVAANSKCK